MMGQELVDEGKSVPKVKVFGAQTEFELQPLDDVTQTFNTPVIFDVHHNKNVIGFTLYIKIFSDADVRFNVIREAEDGGEDTTLVDELYHNLN